MQELKKSVRNLSKRHVNVSHLYADGSHVPWRTDPREAELHHERPIQYEGEVSGACSFFYSIPSVMCRIRGSILDKVWLEMLLTGIAGAVAVVTCVHVTPSYSHVSSTNWPLPTAPPK